MTFNEHEIEALRTLARLWSAQRFVLIGAAAMRVHLGERSRDTHDLDLVLEVTLDRYPAGLETVEHWTRHPRREHTWRAPGNVTVDVIPAGKGGAGDLTWPESGFRMSLMGLPLALSIAETLQIAPDLRIRVAPLAVIALLKMVAFLDRPSERDRDLADLAMLFDEYVPDSDPRRFEDAIVDIGLDYEGVSPFLLARRLGEVVSPPEREAVNRFLKLLKETRDSTAAQARMLAGAPAGWHKDPGALLLRFNAFEQGFGSRSDGR